MPILKDRSTLEEATMADLVETFNALTGQEIAKFANKAVGVKRVDMAMLASINMRGHLGLLEGEEAQVTTLKEMQKIAKAKGRVLPASYDGTKAEVDPPLTKEEVAAQKAAEKEAAKAAKIAAKPVKEPKAPKEPKEPGSGRGRKPISDWYRATGAGTTNVREDSQRGQVLAAITEHTNKKGAAHVPTLTEKLGFGDLRGYIGKLLEKSHIEACEKP